PARRGGISGPRGTRSRRNGRGLQGAAWAVEAARGVKDDPGRGGGGAAGPRAVSPRSGGRGARAASPPFGDPPNPGTPRTAVFLAGIRGRRHVEREAKWNAVAGA